jgi:hypothetical protein
MDNTAVHVLGSICLSAVGLVYLLKMQEVLLEFMMGLPAMLLYRNNHKP